MQLASLYHFYKQLQATAWYARVMALIKFVFVVGIFTLAAFFLYRIFHKYSAEDIENSVGAITTSQLALSAFFTFLCYLILTGYDWLAIRHIKKSLPYRKIALASFVSYAFSHSLGFAVVTSSSTRYRIYSLAGLSASDITRVILLCWATFTLGYTFLLGVSLLLEPKSVLAVTQIPSFYFKLTGVLIMATLVGYVLFGAFRKKPFHILGWELPMPGVKLTLSQLVVSSLDLMAVGAIFYVLLPSSVTIDYIEFLGIMVLAVVAAIFTHVPGGLGVFESVIILFLAPYASSIDLAGALIVYRVFFYVIPLIVAAILFVLHELFAVRSVVFEFIERTNQRISPLAPSLLSVGAFIAGATLLFSGAVPLFSYHRHFAMMFFSSSAQEILHLLASLTGMFLLLVAHGMTHRLKQAYKLSQLLLVFGSLILLLKGLETTGATLLAIILVLHLPYGSSFYRQGSLWRLHYTRGWLISMAVVFIGSVWLGFFYFKHLEAKAAQAAIWMDLEHHSEAVRFLRSSALAGMLGAMIIFFSSWLRPRFPLYLPRQLSPSLLDQLLAPVSDYRKWVMYSGNKAALFSDNGRAFVLCAQQSKYWIAWGDPIGDVSAARDAVWKVQELSDATRSKPVFFGVSSTFLPLYLDLKLTLFAIGEEAIVELSDFSLGAVREHVRHHHALAGEANVFTAVYYPPHQNYTLISELQNLAQQWKSVRGSVRRHFMGGVCTEAYLSRTPFLVLSVNESIVGFATLLLAGDKEMAALDIIELSPHSPSLPLDYLVLSALLWAKENGYQRFSLGLSPLAEKGDSPSVTLLQMLSHDVFDFNSQLENFAGLRYFKGAFSPRWETRYLAVASGLHLPSVLADINHLVEKGWDTERLNASALLRGESS